MRLPKIGNQTGESCSPAPTAGGLLKQVAISSHLYGPLRRAYQRWIFNAYEEQFRNDLEFYSQFLSSADLCFDIGANIGQKTEVFLALGARVISFEPQPNCFAEMVARCGPNRRLTAVNAAVGAAPGQLPMYVSASAAVSSLLADWEADVREVIKVRVTTLDKEIRRCGLPRFCKIDVEGYEWEVLQGLSTPLPCLSLEYHLNVKDIQKILNCVDYLVNLGGELEMNVTLGETMKFSWPNWIGYESFRDFFPDKAPRTGTCGYGDLFVRMRSVE